MHPSAFESPRSPLAAVVLAVAVLFGFLSVQVFAAGAVAIASGAIEIRGDVSAGDALWLSVIQVAGIVAALALVAGGVSSRVGAGLVAPAGATWAGIGALVPVGALVILPTIGALLATGGDLLHPGLGAAQVASFILLAVLISVNEELWFRGLVVDALGGERRPWLVIVGSSLLFGLPHLSFTVTTATAFNMIGVTLAVGVPFAVVRLRCRSLVPLVFWHAVIDIWAFLHTSSVIAEGDPSPAKMAAGLVIPLGLAIGYARWFARGGVSPATGRTPSSGDVGP